MRTHGSPFRNPNPYGKPCYSDPQKVLDRNPYSNPSRRTHRDAKEKTGAGRRGPNSEFSKAGKGWGGLGLGFFLGGGGGGFGIQEFGCGVSGFRGFHGKERPDDPTKTTTIVTTSALASSSSSSSAPSGSKAYRPARLQSSYDHAEGPSGEERDGQDVSG